jgi:hypothetical protein
MPERLTVQGLTGLERQRADDAAAHADAMDAPQQPDDEKGNEDAIWHG